MKKNGSRIALFREMPLNVRLVMKLTMICLFVSMLYVKANVYSQKMKVSLDYNNVELREIFEAIESSTEFKFLYNSRKIDASRRVSIHVEQIPLAEALSNLFEGAGIAYVLRKKQIILKPYSSKEIQSKTTKNISPNEIALLQQSVSGTVTDAGGNPLPGATVLEKGTTNGTQTDFDGNYNITVSSQNTVLVFSYIGYQEVERTVGQANSIDITLQESTATLDEVVIVGYGSVKKSDLTGSVAQVSGEALQEFPIVSVDQGLQGRAPGIQVTQSSSAPGGGISVRIRGGSSFSSGSEPLYVIDGFPVYSDNGLADPSGARASENAVGDRASGYTSANALASLNPGDIESINILKDASATAIYGSRGANGVVIITTKRGKSGKSRINFESYYGIQTVARTYDVLNAQEFVSFANDWASRRGEESIFTESPASFGQGTDWQNEVYQNAAIENYQVSAQGGTDKIRYALSTNYFNQEGIIKESGFRRYSLRVNLDSNISDKLSVGNNLTISRTINDRVLTEGDIAGRTTAGVTYLSVFTDPTLPIRDENGNFTNNEFNSQLRSRRFRDNPVELTQGIHDRTLGIRLLGNIFADYKFTDDLSFRVSFGGDFDERTRDVYYDRFVEIATPVNGLASIASVRRESFLNENVLTFSKNFYDKHNFQAVAGFTWQQETFRNTSQTATGFINDILKTDAIGNAEVLQSQFSSKTRWNLLSGLGRINYEYNNKYLATISFRADGSSKFSEDNKWGFFPSAALAWRVSEEPFLRESSVISNLKLRGSYGEIGNQEIGVNQSQLTLGNQQYLFDNTINNGVFPTGPSNDELRWETTRQLDLGIDFGFFNGALRGSVDYYRKTTKDLLLNVELPANSGFSSALINAGEIENKGFEFNIDATPFNGEFVWSTNFNYSANRSEVIDLGPLDELFAPAASLGFSPSRPSSIIRAGEPLGAFYGWTTNGGIIADASEVDANAIALGLQPGDVNIRDVDGDGDLDNDDRTVIGDPNPDFIFGWTNNFSYKNFDLSLFIQGVIGNDIYHITRSEIQRTDALRGNKLRTVLTDVWSPENPNGRLPRWDGARIANPFQVLGSDYWNIEDGSFIRLKNISLGYNIPVDKMAKSPFTRARVYVSAQNVFTITDYSGLNPDVNTQGQSSVNLGYDVGTYPLARVINLGFNVEF